jgi:hypothetical protein
MASVGRHFIAMTFVVETDAGPKADCASCFVVDLDGVWILVTAGHVIEDLASAIAGGRKVSSVDLQDKFAGSRWPTGVPLGVDTFALWTWFNKDAIDYAFLPLKDYYVQQLAKGGVQPITREAWDDGYAYEKLAVLGIPSESLDRVGRAHLTISPTFVPLEIVDVPAGVALSHPSQECARLIDESNAAGVVLNDMAGMSGAPVYGFRMVDGRLKYWLVGIQSGWLKTRRLALVYPVRPFLEATKAAVDRMFQRLERGLSPQQGGLTGE